MCLLVESIKILDGDVQNIEFHNERFNRTMRELFKSTKSEELSKYINISDEFKKGIVKCRVLYSKDGVKEVDFEYYKARNLKKVTLVEDDLADYTYKAVDRDFLKKYSNNITNESDIIIVKNGKLTDASFANIVLDDGFELLTPSTPLLLGTKRAKYIKEGVIKSVEIRKKDFYKFKKVHFINALLDLGECSVSL